MRPGRPLCVLLLTACLPGCGTVLSRAHGDFLGAPPGAAVATDVLLMVMAVDDGGTTDAVAAGFAAGLLSLPFDLVVDVVLLPADLIGWAFGLEKHGRC